MDVFDLLARISLDTSEYQDGLNEAEDKTSSFGSKLKSGIGTATKIGATAVTALATTVVAGGKALIDGAGSVASYGDEIDKASQKLGISAEAYQEWDFILQHSGSNVGALTAVMKTMNANVESGSEAFEQLGISQEELANLSTEELLSRTITALQGVEDETLRNALASDTLGKKYMELNPLLNTSVEETEAMRQQVHELGGVMSDSAVKDSARYQDSLKNAQVAVSGLKNAFMSELLPSFADVLDGFSALVSGTDESGEQFSKGIETAIDSVMDMLPRLITVGGKLVSSLITGIVKNAPKLLSSAKNLLTTVINGILEALPMILDMLPEVMSTVMDLLFDVIDSILEALPTLIETLAQSLPELISTFISKILENLPSIIEGLINVVLAIAENLPTIIMGIIDELPHIIDLLITAVMESLPLLISGAIDLVLALVEHLPEIIIALIEAIPTIIEKVATAVVENFPKIILAVVQGLAKLLDKIGTWFAELLGFVDEEGDGIWDNVGAWFSNLFKQLGDWLSGIWEDISHWFTGLITDIGNWFSNIWNDISTWFTGLITDVANWFTDVWNKVSGFFVDTWNTVTSKLSEIWNKVSEWFTGLIADVGEWASGIIDSITGFFANAWELGKNLVTGIWEGISGTAQWLWDKITGWLSSVWDGIKSFFGVKSPSKQMAWLGEMMVEGLSGGIDKYGSEAVDSALALAEDVNDAMSGLNTSYSFAGDGALTGGQYQGSEQYYWIVQAFKEALSEMRIELDGDEMGVFIDKTVSKLVYVNA